ncbi:GNAT family N-acetyltransferase [Acidovorax sp. RAC01]|uniref:GNAT family N-acetyltransferase n=1 Tax=Acidovorax sp. RAC01 TaxID=1842533 RepID=UPI00083E72FA|nr:GNAT family N-acetyltransferase [Acidovorax sp. RAC01]AOG25207.1 acetyltransferase family protein [Acidovorax sp. RAC01]
MPHAPSLLIRQVNATDDLQRLTDLIHSAYAPHAQEGLRYWGTHQTVEDTAKRFASGTGIVMLDGDRYVGTITLRPPQPESAVALYRDPGVWTLCQFCIAPAAKGLGYGRRLHDHATSVACHAGATTMALDTARQAAALIAMYETWGYRQVGECDWRPLTNYTSVVMSRMLAGTADPLSRPPEIST